jgi:formylglycine-generating enzyme required for sulfatase activity
MAGMFLLIFICIGCLMKTSFSTIFAPGHLLIENIAIHMAFKAPFEFPVQPSEYAAEPVPSLADWNDLWTVWDIVTKQMIPDDELLEKPIKLRNACIFYLGHIPTFLEIQLAKASGKRTPELDYYQKIFERGIDPDVDNPELCHDHSEIPDSWPPIEDIFAYQDKVRDVVRGIMDSGAPERNPDLAKALWIGFEHEAMHMETLLYMLVQSEKTLPPKGVVEPNFEGLAAEAASKAMANEWVSIPAQDVTIGMVDPDDPAGEKRFFGWDNEKPSRKVSVPAFRAKAKPITNREYLAYLKDSGVRELPASWIEVEKHLNGSSNGSSNGHNGVTNGAKTGSFVDDKAVRTVFGNVPLKYALDWPIMASFNELEAYALWRGDGRIPTMEEVRSIYEHVEELKKKESEKSIGKKIPAVNSHLINDGVEETPPSNGTRQGLSSNGAGPIPDDLFADLSNANVGFRTWYPVAVTLNSELAGQGETGGIWEWTSSVLEKHEGFEPMKLYPGYTGEFRPIHVNLAIAWFLTDLAPADFHDGKHNVVLGGSWATHPRIAGRKTL